VSRNSKKFSQSQLNPKILEEIEKMKASMQRNPQSVNTIKEDKNPSKASSTNFHSLLSLKNI